ncbi:MAG TPA: DUF3710 domain-containing protein [Nocardioidaceae bacterium]|nr:DUF3710 domain-containing protein [Nocardioidaceae bacterium]
MIFRRRKGAHVRPDGAAEEEVEESTDPTTHRERVGPWDSDEREVDTEEGNAIDLGGLIVIGRSGLELRLQTDQATGTVGAAMLVSKDGAVELRVFAASRSGGMWDDIRREIAAEASNRGGTATEADGPYGTELRVKVPIKAADGRQGTQTSRIVGIEGPRWLLRATYLGDAATESDPDGALESAVRDVVVVRGGVAMPPREPIPLRLPPGAEPGEPAEPT